MANKSRCPRGFRVTCLDDPDTEHTLLDPGSQRTIPLAGILEAASERAREHITQIKDWRDSQRENQREIRIECRDHNHPQQIASHEHQGLEQYGADNAGDHSAVLVNAVNRIPGPGACVERQ